MAVRSLFHTQIQIAGKAWDFAVVDNLDGRISVSAMGGESDCLILRPVEPGAQPFGSCATSHMDIINCPPTLFVNNCAFNMDYAFNNTSKPVSVNLKIKPIVCNTGTMKLTGDPVGFLILEGDTTVIVDAPSDEFAIPVGSYPKQRLTVTNASRTKDTWCLASERLKVFANNSEVFNVDLAELTDNSPTYGTGSRTIVKSRKIVVGSGMQSSGFNRMSRPARASSG
jgi:hypothetical protein